jgi:hypothetical protein
MAAPNLYAIATITGKVDGMAIGTSATDVVTNAASSGFCYKINSLYVCNATGSSKYITIDLYRASIAYRLTYQLPIPANATIPIIQKDAPLYLEEGDKIRATSEAIATHDIVVSYEKLS